MINTQHFKSAKKALLLSMAATGLLSLANSALATGICKPYSPWAEGGSYSSGSKVTYKDIDYEALTSHTAYVGANWNPAASPTLWKSLGTCSNWEVVQRPTPTPPPTPSALPTQVTVETSNVTRFGPCTDVPDPEQTPMWSPATVYSAGTYVRPAGAYRTQMGWIRFKAKVTHTSTANNAPTYNNTSVTYDAALWDVENVVPGACPTGSQRPTPTPTFNPTPTPLDRYNGWNSTAVYNAGHRVTYNGRAYEAKWWVQGHAPNAADQWGPWKDLGSIVLTTPTPTIRISVSPTPCLGAPKPTWPAKAGHTWVYFGSKPGSTSCGTDYWAEVPDITTTPTPSPSPTATPTPIDSNYVTSVKTTTWKNGAKGAYSLVHDDYCSMPAGTDPYIKIMDPELSKRGLVAGFGIITGSCSPQQWAAAKQMIANGHEIVSDSRSHPNPYIADAELEVQLNGAASDIAANLDGYKASYFVWPGDAASTAGTTFLKDNTQYLGGRASHLVANGNVDYTTMPAGVNAANFDNPYRIKWDLFTVDGKWSVYAMGSEILNLHIDEAIKQGGWATRTMHGVDTGYWETAPLARYQAHLDYAKAKVDAGELWMDTPSNVLKYRFAREFCISVLDNDGPHSAALFKTWAPECKQYATPVTLEFTTQATTAEQMDVTQDEKALVVTARGNNTYLVTVNPLGGMVKFKLKP